MSILLYFGAFEMSILLYFGAFEMRIRQSLADRIQSLNNYST